ncbi:MAG: PKD domain-containing protein [Thermoplasmata archaeon]|nr:MAG: PKD domain-containing protein [Thermoplasmata archaeon]
MVDRDLVGPALVALVMLTALVAGCLEEEETPPPPEPRVEMTGPSEAWVGEVVQFETLKVKDDDTKFEALDFHWRMGDNTTYKGKPFISEWISGVNHTFEHEGVYNVTVTVSDPWGNQGIANHSIFVRYQLNMTVNHGGKWISEDALNNTTYCNLTVKNVWTGQFDVPLVRVRLCNETGGELAPRAQTGDPVPANLTAGDSFTIQVHFVVPVDYNWTYMHVTDELEYPRADV